MKRMNWIVGIVFLLCWPAVGRAGLVVDRPPLNTGGLGSDTEFFGMSGTPTWQRLADDILLSATQTVDPIRRVNWWGFYNLNNPPVTETMRIRFYGARLGDGLPDDSNIVFEESFLNPTRTATGRQVAVGVGPDELMFQVDLTTPLHLTPDTPYWMEIVQIGDLNTAFRWEVSTSIPALPLASINPIRGDWGESAKADNAFQLSTIPEPGTCVLFLAAASLIGRCRTTNTRIRRRSKT